MPSVEELLNSDEQEEQIETYAEENEELVIDAETRVINIPESEVLFGVKGDKNIERKYFRCPKIVGDNVDLSKHLIYIAYVYTESNSGSIFPTVGIQPYHCDDVAVDGDDITFSWKLSENVFQSAGFIVFKMYAKEKEDSPYTVFNTAPAIGTVLYTIGDGVESIVSEYPDIINQLLAEMEGVQEIATPEAMQGYVNAYLEENPVQGGITEEQKQQLEQNTQDITDLKSNKVNKSGWAPDKYLGTDSDGNIIVKDAPDDSGGGTEPSSQNLIDPSQYKNSGYSGTLFDEFGANRNVFDNEIDTSENKILYFRVYRNNFVNSYNVDMDIACYDSNGQYLFTMKATNEYSDNYEQVSSVFGTDFKPIETIENAGVAGKIIALVSIPENVYKVKFGIWAAGPMTLLFYPAFAVSYSQITNYGSLTDGDYSLIQGSTSGGESDTDTIAYKPLLNKTFLMIGDSLTNWGGGGDTRDGFLKIIHDRTGVTTVNQGLAGATWEEADGQTQPGVTRVDTYVSGFVRYDCIGFLLGTNVANQGNTTDTSSTKTTMCGAIKYCLEQLIALSPTTPIIVFLPPQRAEGNTGQRTRNDMIKQICETYGVYTFDLYTRSQVIPNTTVEDNGTLSDGLHLSEKGQQNFGRIMSSAILNVMGY